MPVRPATGDDVPAIRALVERAFVVYVPRIGRRPAPMDEDYTAAVERGGVLVADDGGTLRGVLVLVDAADHVLVETVAVDPARQGRGLGAALMAEAERHARTLGVSELRLYTNAAMTENVAWYRTLGYREVGRRRDAGFDRVFFVKGLG